MNLKPLYISAPSRSGSSLLTKVINCARNIVVVNEPLNSVDISDRSNIMAIFNSIEENLNCGFVMQRIDADGLEVTDTFPPSKIKWGKLACSSKGIKVIGVKKSFPAFSNKDFFRPFIDQWRIFVKWMVEDLNGGVVVIVRDPRFTILSWKTTFDALKENTENQCAAWNLIANTILSSRDLGVKIVRYEDLVASPAVVVRDIASYLNIKTDFKKVLPEIKQTFVEDFLNRDVISIGSIEICFREVEKKCGGIAKEFGYTNMIF